MGEPFATPKAVRFAVDRDAAAELVEWVEPRVKRIPLSGGQHGAFVPWPVMGDFSAIGATLAVLQSTWPELFASVDVWSPLVRRYTVGEGFPRHHDVSGGSADSQRLLSATLQLSRGHRGGRFRCWPDGDAGMPLTVATPGMGLAFLSEVEHEVTPVEEGVRYALVVWGWGSPA